MSKSALAVSDRERPLQDRLRRVNEQTQTAEPAVSKANVTKAKGRRIVHA